ncbi:MAG: enoyl-CoA hydratase/isomerase family protein [Acidimicrobiales bacterium]
MAQNRASEFGVVGVEVDQNHVALVEVRTPPHNFFSLSMLGSLADAFEAVDADPDARCILLASEGKNFCAGASLNDKDPKLTSEQSGGERHIYDEAVRLFAANAPVVAAVQGAAVGGGLGLACMADFRVGGPGTRMTANFARLGFHQGFGLSVTLPAIVGQQNALDLLYTGRRIKGDRAAEIGLIDRLVSDDEIRSAAAAWAAEIAGSAPLAVESIRQTMRGHLPAEIRSATDREREEQERLRDTADWKEGVAAMTERRDPKFERRSPAAPDHRSGSGTGHTPELVARWVIVTSNDSAGSSSTT